MSLSRSCDVWSPVNELRRWASSIDRVNRVSPDLLWHLVLSMMKLVRSLYHVGSQCKGLRVVSIRNIHNPRVQVQRHVRQSNGQDQGRDSAEAGWSVGRLVGWSVVSCTC